MTHIIGKKTAYSVYRYLCTVLGERGAMVALNASYREHYRSDLSTLLDAHTECGSHAFEMRGDDGLWCVRHGNEWTPRMGDARTAVAVALAILHDELAVLERRSRERAPEPPFLRELMREALANSDG